MPMTTQKLTRRQADALATLQNSSTVTLTVATEPNIWRHYRALVVKGLATETKVSSTRSDFRLISTTPAL